MPHHIEAQVIREVETMFREDIQLLLVKKESVSKGQRGYRWTFKTKIAEDTITPAWNEHFEIDDVTEEDLPNMNIEMTVMDYYKLLTNKPLGQIRIGPGQHRDNQHWEEMLLQP